MLIEWVKDSVLRCFCQSCKSAVVASVPDKPHLKDSKPKNSKKVVFIATEIRAAEKAKGGMAYEVILAQPTTENPPKQPDSPPKSISAEDIENKLKAAEERRQSMEAQKLSQLAEKLNRIEEVSMKKAEHNTNFINQTKEQLEQKMESNQENRDAYLCELKAKLKEHDNRIAEVRKTMEMHREEMKENIDKKLTTASEYRKENLQKKIDKLKEHEENILKVRKLYNDKIQQLEEKIEKKLEVAQGKRDDRIMKKVESLKEHDKRVLHVRQNNDHNVKLNEEKMVEYHEKLKRANTNRSEKQTALKMRLVERERHAEEVRQNKAQSIMSSSG